jgi:hypothetical protein
VSSCPSSTDLQLTHEHIAQESEVALLEGGLHLSSVCHAAAAEQLSGRCGKWGQCWVMWVPELLQRVRCCLVQTLALLLLLLLWLWTLARQQRIGGLGHGTMFSDDAAGAVPSTGENLLSHQLLLLQKQQESSG